MSDDYSGYSAERRKAHMEFIFRNVPVLMIASYQGFSQSGHKGILILEEDKIERDSKGERWTSVFTYPGHDLFEKLVKGSLINQRERIWIQSYVPASDLLIGFLKDKKLSTYFLSFPAVASDPLLQAQMKSREN